MERRERGIIIHGGRWAPWTTRQKRPSSRRLPVEVVTRETINLSRREWAKENEKEKIESERKKARVPSICFRDCIVEHLLRYVPRASKCCYKIKA